MSVCEVEKSRGTNRRGLLWFSPLICDSFHFFPIFLSILYTIYWTSIELLQLLTSGCRLKMSIFQSSKLGCGELVRLKQSWPEEWAIYSLSTKICRSKIMWNELSTFWAVHWVFLCLSDIQESKSSFHLLMGWFLFDPACRSSQLIRNRGFQIHVTRIPAKKMADVEKPSVEWPPSNSVANILWTLGLLDDFWISLVHSQHLDMWIGLTAWWLCQELGQAPVTVSCESGTITVQFQHVQGRSRGAGGGLVFDSLTEKQIGWPSLIKFSDGSARLPLEDRKTPAIPLELKPNIFETPRWRHP